MHNNMRNPVPISLKIFCSIYLITVTIMLSFSHFRGKKKTCELSSQILENPAIKKHKALHTKFVFELATFNNKVCALAKYRIHSVSTKVWLADHAKRNRLFIDGKALKLDPANSRPGWFCYALITIPQSHRALSIPIKPDRDRISQERLAPFRNKQKIAIGRSCNSIPINCDQKCPVWLVY